MPLFSCKILVYGYLRVVAELLVTLMSTMLILLYMMF